MLERTVARALTQAAKKAGVFMRKCRWEGRVGAPDYIAIYNGRAYFIETKAPGETPRASQIAEFMVIRSVGVPVWIVDSPTAAEAAVRAIQEDSPYETLSD